MKKAFTLLELIFVVVIVGILVGVASSSFKTDYLRNDAEFILAKIKQAQYKGIGYEHNSFGTQNATADYDNGCIRLEKGTLEESATQAELTYSLHVDSFDAGTICFDSKGRPHETDFSSANLLSANKVIELTYNGETKKILILPISGFAIISCNN